jgi:hypothetical protein
MVCKCGSYDYVILPRPDTVHGFEKRCNICKEFLGWAGKPENKEKREKRPPYPTPEELNIDYCQFCRRTKSELNELETLHTHHLNGNPTDNSRLNLIVFCTCCHTLCHHEILYHHDHRKRL